MLNFSQKHEKPNRVEFESNLPAFSREEERNRIMELSNQILLSAIGEVSEDYPEEWGDIPLAYSKSQSSAGLDFGNLAMSLQQQIEKAASNRDDAVVAVMKEVKKLLLDIDKGE